ncbi:MAG: hypothetical protein KGS61_16170, partial [Verrucomicrobia bacterium]|nr:hypothetical protein [Verrucomicrobiota bacterium]
MNPCLKCWLRSCFAFGVALTRLVFDGQAAEVASPLGPPGVTATYRIEAGSDSRGSSVERFTLSLGPVEPAKGGSCQWLELQAVKVNGERFAVWVLARQYPARTLAAARANTARYLFQEGDDPPQEYADRFTGAAVLPSLGAWEYLWPRPASDDFRDGVVAARVSWLGHAYAFEPTNRTSAFPVPREVHRLALLPDVLVGVPSTSRTRDDSRRYDGSDYPMVRLTRADFTEMIRAGMNCFHVDAEQARWLRDEPVFYWGVGGSDVPFPECLFRSTYLGPALFLDEPAVGTRDYVIRPRLAKDPAFGQEITPQVVLEGFKAHFHQAVREGAPTVLVKGLRGRADVDLGTMRIPQRNLYSWETMIASAAWQLTAEPDGGPCALVFEPPGRLGSHRTLPEMNMAYGCELPPDDPANLADVINGFLRGAARVAHKDWGVSIYGAVDGADAPWLLTHAYDLGAKYFFFWDNAQLACVPYGECLALSRHLWAHVENYPERDLDRLRHAAEVAILLPPGYNLGHVQMGRGNLWGLGELNLERTNRYGIRYRQVMGNFFTEIERCRRLSVAFDLLWDLDGLSLDGYREIVRVREDGRVEVLAHGRRTVRDGPRVPERPGGEPPQLVVELSGLTGGVPCTVTARARVTEGSAPIYYTTGADRRGVYHNVRVMWELYGPEAEDYRAPVSRVLEPEAGTGASRT